MYHIEMIRALKIYFRLHPCGCIWKIENHFIYPDDCHPEYRISFRELFDKEGSQ